MTRSRPHPASFRDPSGGIQVIQGTLYRTVDASYLPHLARLAASGLLKTLWDRGLLVQHQALRRPFPFPTAAAVLKPAPVPFISYPYEWCFGQWKDAALLTVRLARLAHEHGMTLKDASAYNVQFHGGRPLWIDTLSFEISPQPVPWIAYRQFCRHFLATLAAMSRIHVNWGLYFRGRMDGFDLLEVSRALPSRTWADLFLLGHLHFQSRLEGRSLAWRKERTPRMTRVMLEGLWEDLERGLERLRGPKGPSLWSGYGEAPPYPPSARQRKMEIVSRWIRRLSPETVWDLGANTGIYSLEAARHAGLVIALDSDHASVERLWGTVRSRRIGNLLPLRMDLADPTPSQGWNGRERSSLMERGPADLALALALVHHLVFGALVPLRRLPEFMARCGQGLILEFPGPGDPQVKALAAGRSGLAAAYRREELERSFSSLFRIEERIPLPSCDRVLYRMKRRSSS